MECNVGGADKTIRIILGIIVIALGVIYKSWFGAIGAVFLVTGLIGYCPLYSLFRKSSCCKTEPPKAGGEPKGKCCCHE
jgi:hypothetical protein